MFVNVAVGEIESAGLADGVGDVCTLVLLVDGAVPLQAETGAINRAIENDIRMRIFHPAAECNCPLLLIQ